MGRETLFEKRVLSPLYNPSFPKNFNYEQILLVVKKFRERGV